MKKLKLLAVLAIGALMFSSCSKIDYKSFVGTWGVEKIDYYNIDYAGNPIAGSMESYDFDPNSTDNGIQLIFRDNKKGEMRDSAIDSLAVIDEETDEIDHYIVCPDTVMVYPFVYTYDESSKSLYMEMDYGDRIRTFRMYISNFTDNSFIYENEYKKDYVEKAYLKRISNTTSKSASREMKKHPHKPGSFLSGR